MSFRRLVLALPLIVLLCAIVSACGARADLTNPDQVYLPDSGLPDGVTPPPPSCGNGKCDNGETCSNCPIDCGFCMGCGDGTCQPTENCLNCPQDCGSCPLCGDGKCENPPENCVNCPQDCGECASCGDGKCNGAETCFNCPQDCGTCPGCGDGTCGPDETCISCPVDCGVCSVCGNGKCEAPYETCTNCPADCGACTVKTCFESFTCVIGCIGFGMGGPPMVNLACIANCVADGCADTQYFLNQAVNCALDSIIGGGDAGSCMSPSCIETVCGPQIAACLGATCK
jgi:hypothetical protein